MHGFPCAFFSFLMKRYGTFFSLFFLFVFCAVQSAGAAFRSGIDVLEASGCRALQGKRVALVTNAAAVTASGESNYVMLQRNGTNLKFLMAPEHGFRLDVEAGKKTEGIQLSDSLRVYSLYGSTKKPDVQLLQTVDLVVFDLQDVGARCYTYISTMKLVMEACQEAGRPFMVLDRPNPVSPLAPAGFMLEKGYESFVGAAEVPFLHAMTVGEIALLLKKRGFRNLDLSVVQMEGYQRGLFGDELPGYRFVSPSPNIRNIETAIVYPATVMLEATAVSEGRGTDAPFLQFGAPFIDGRALAASLASSRLPGVMFSSVEFTPETGKFKGERCSGVRLAVTDRRVFEPFRTSAAILLSLHKSYPRQIALDKGADFFDKLAGTARFREMILQQSSVDRIIETARRDVDAFVRTSQDVLLYR